MARVEICRLAYAGRLEAVDQNVGARNSAVEILQFGAMLLALITPMAYLLLGETVSNFPDAYIAAGGVACVITLIVSALIHRIRRASSLRFDPAGRKAARILCGFTVAGIFDLSISILSGLIFITLAIVC